MPSFSFDGLPREIIYLIFQYLHQQHIAYAFLSLNRNWASAVRYFLGENLSLTNPNDESIVNYSFSTVLPSIGFQLRSITIDYPCSLLKYIEIIGNFCPNLDSLTIHCCREEDDIRRSITYLLHRQSISLTLKFQNEIVGEDLSLRLLNRFDDDPNRTMFLAPSLILHLSSIDDLTCLERFIRSSFLPDGYYMIESLSTGQWLTDSHDDLILTKNKCHYDSIFFIRQNDRDQCSREYEIFKERNQSRLSVLKPSEYEDEYWLSSSILSTQRKESPRTSYSFTFESIGNDLGFYIRPSYFNARRLQVSGKRIILSLCNYQTTIDHCFKLHRISN